MNHGDISMPEDIKEIVGFDLGDGETALALIRINQMVNSEILTEPEIIEINRKKSNITAIGYYPDKRIEIGARAILSKEVSGSIMNFKARPDKVPPEHQELYQNTMKNYINAFILILNKERSSNNEKRLYVIGCPSKWTNDNGSKEIVTLYEEMARQAGAAIVMVVSESLAALIHVYESGILAINPSEVEKPILVIDIGSSTTDFTLIDLSKRKSSPINSGCDLGARLIDKAILDYSCEHNPGSEDLYQTLKSRPHLMNRCLLECRYAKERYYKDPDCYPGEGDSVYQTVELDSNLSFSVRVDGQIMAEILEHPLVDMDGKKQSWPSVFEKELRRLITQEMVKPEIVLLTGGASRMDFVQRICRQVFPDARCVVDNEPEFCIAKGLARHGGYHIRFEWFIVEVNQILNKILNATIRERLPLLLDSISTCIASSLIDDIIRPEIRSWDGDIWDSSFRERINERVKKTVTYKRFKKLTDNVVALWLREITKTIDVEVNSLARKYNLGEGALAIGGITPKIDYEIDIPSHIKDISLDAWSPFGEIKERISSWIEGRKMDWSIPYTESKIDEALSKGKDKISLDIKTRLSADSQLANNLVKDAEKVLRDEIVRNAESVFARVG